MITNYTIEEHIHRYACWTAARAASISRFSNVEINQFIDKIDLRTKLIELKASSLSHTIYKEWFIKQVNAVLKNMKEYIPIKEKGNKRNILFSIAAKVVSIYIKTAEIIPSGGTSSVSLFAFPPIDSYLLSGLGIKNKVWSTMEQEEFINLLDSLRNQHNDKPFWSLEFFWDLNKKGHAKKSNL